MYAGITLGLLIAFSLLDGAARIWIQRRRTGDTGVRRPTNPVQWWARGTFAVGILLSGLIAPLFELTGLSALAILDRQAVRVLGVAIAALGLLGTFGAQFAMGASWRTTVDPTEQPALVTTGPFRIVRNPVYTTVIIMTIGFVLTVPNVIAIVGVGAVITGSQLQVRLVEEPYLSRIHGAAYLNYAADVGRFLPGIGRTD
ncbi:isoprenylcysteine carboxylmethyltransferase family protein [Saccharopolyspora sp. HNM0986]|uniref:methyltransferase family protein n=1 Tax=Saccharopolyspora galaxeae TaxID=2781241 RepID=UPI00190A59AD|nr:isoprenylcysteine carboxylmethyltransferase family protein [Saccharopolyspora sp. HNM0986]MBK0868699.1 isoprenylcysteine carboxylmethyltransferase family protein [Saccharopolyspora sp. HNM0986]